MLLTLHSLVLGERGVEVQECYVQDVAICLISRKLKKIFTKRFECLSSVYLSLWVFFENSIVCFLLRSLNNASLLAKEVIRLLLLTPSGPPYMLQPVGEPFWWKTSGRLNKHVYP